MVESITLSLSPSEVKAVRKGRRGCSCEAVDLTALGERCMGIARECKALSWSIYPIIGSQVGVAKVYVEFHNWKEMGMCNFKTPIGKPRYHWDERPMPNWITGDERGPKDEDGHFDVEA